jgi:hypothetical protein
MGNTRYTLLPVADPLDGSETLGLAQASVSKRATIDQIITRGGGGTRHNSSVASQGPGFASDTYLVGSSIVIPDGRLQAKSMYRCVFSVTKTAAGVATPIINIRFGTAGTTADASRAVLTFAAQTAVVDQGMFTILANFNTVGSGTSAVIGAAGTLSHGESNLGLGVERTGMRTNTGGGFDSTVASSILGVSVNGGASAAWTIALVQADLLNLA